MQAGDYGNFLGSALGSPNGSYSLDVTASIAAWAGGSPNRGWIFQPTNTNGVDFRSSEYATLAARPWLEVTYRTGPVEPAVQLLFDIGDQLITYDTAQSYGYNDGTLNDVGMWFPDPDRGSVIDLDGAGDHVTVDPIPLMMDNSEPAHGGGLGQE